MRLRELATVGLLATAGCFSPNASADGDLGDAMPDDLPPGGCRDTTGGAEDCETEAAPDPSTTGASTGAEAEDDRCGSVDDCNGGRACAAAWDPETNTRGPLECQFACVPILDERAWCIDDASCCDANAVCTARGYCIVEREGSSTGGSSSGGGSSSTG
ncbi:MAG: hypothetical protein AAGA54_27820 [Myxococcota bacterium]